MKPDISEIKCLNIICSAFLSVNHFYAMVKVLINNFGLT